MTDKERIKDLTARVRDLEEKNDALNRVLRGNNDSHIDDYIRFSGNYDERCIMPLRNANEKLRRRLSRETESVATMSKELRAMRAGIRRLLERSEKSLDVIGSVVEVSES